MRVLMVRPIAPNERFGLGPFFRIESLGVEYVAAALESAGHQVRFVDLRFRRLESAMADFRPEVVGVACAHTLDTSEALATAARVKAIDPRAFVLVGGHAAAVYPKPLLVPSVDAICCEDGERVVPELLSAIQRRAPLDECRGLWLRDGGDWTQTPSSPERVSLDVVPLPARHLMRPYQKNFLCLNRQPVWLVETARGCPYRCSFCTIWRHVDRSYRCRDVETVCDDLAQVGPNVFMADDLFFYPTRRSADLARRLLARGIHKKWILVQTRTDLVARNAALLQTWRPVSDDIDLFFGFEAPTDQGLAGFTKDAGVDETREAVAVCRRYNYGVTGNFIIDPNWVEEDFERLWDFIARMDLGRVGFTIMTPLPGTPLFEEHLARIVEKDWAKFDMHHILWEPRLGRQRFFELLGECWRRTVLNAKKGGRKPWWKWLHGIRPAQIPTLARVLINTQRMMDPKAYLREAFPIEQAAQPEPTAASDEMSQSPSP